MSLTACGLWAIQWSFLGLFVTASLPSAHRPGRTHTAIRRHMPAEASIKSRMR